MEQQIDNFAMNAADYQSIQNYEKMLDNLVMLANEIPEIRDGYVENICRRSLDIIYNCS